ncbi:MAG TPA: response regulator transcription factor [Anaerolineae bacterium]|nr:response regulator transcription factor [Anaerolineae bacterium]HNU03373.1 response regulator transcription factor [Anaerolineae bacterium]
MKALIVDDDRVLADVLAFTLRREGFEIVLAHDGESALQRFSEELPDLVVLDVNMPRLDGFAVCRRLRSLSDTPIILLTVRGEEDDIVHGLELGADDYLTKPFSPRQLAARAQAVLRRSRAGRQVAGPGIRRVGNLALDASRREMRVLQEGAEAAAAGAPALLLPAESAGQEAAKAFPPISLTALESRLLAYLMLNAGHVLTADAIIDHVWGEDGGDRDMLRQLVHRLRGKIKDASDGAGGQQAGIPTIETIPGVGYGLTRE